MRSCWFFWFGSFVGAFLLDWKQGFLIFSAISFFGGIMLICTTLLFKYIVRKGYGKKGKTNRDKR